MFSSIQYSYIVNVLAVGVITLVELVNLEMPNATSVEKLATSRKYVIHQ